MSDVLLRLRTARALRWELIGDWDSASGDHYEDWRMPDGAPWTFGTDETGAMDYDSAMPRYGTTWASCEEVDAEIKEREWLAQIDMDGNTTRVFLFTSANGLIGTRLSTATAPTFPAAFCEAFCLAVEANDVNAQ